MTEEERQEMLDAWPDRECEQCGEEVSMRFSLNADPTQRCLHCHETARGYSLESIQDDDY